MKNTYIFDGVKFAIEKEQSLRDEVNKLKKSGVTPSLISLLVGSNANSQTYLRLKGKAAERIGARVKVANISQTTPTDKIVKIVKKLNKEPAVHGVMLQLPLPENYSPKEKERIIEEISKEKDVDGMREHSKYLTPVVSATLLVLEEARRLISSPSKNQEFKVVVVGADGFVGKRVVKALMKIKYSVTGVDIDTKNLAKSTLEADVLISATGASEIITGNMVKKGVIVLDLGAPEGDVITTEVSQKASFISPVPGGIGPVTISSLLENLIKASS